MKENEKILLNILKKKAEKEDKFENLVLNLAIKRLKGAKNDDKGVYYSKGMKHVVMASKTLEGDYVIKEGVTDIDDNAFWGCAFVQTITIPDTVTTIGDEAFGRCLSLKDLVIPKSVKKIGINPFIGMNASGVRIMSEEYVIEEGLLMTADKKAVIACMSSRDKYVIPNTVEAINGMAFARNHSLKSIILPEGLKTIGNDAFSDCDSLGEITIPSTVTSIGSYAFSECDELRKVTFLGEVKKISRTAFSDCYALGCILVPKGKIVKYRKALHMQDYEDTVVEDPTIITKDNSGKQEKPKNEAKADNKKKKAPSTDERKATN